MEVLTCLIRAMFVINIIKLEVIGKVDKKYEYKYILFNLLGYYILELQSGNYRAYLVQYVYIFIIFYLFAQKVEIKKKNILPIICATLGIFEIVVLLTGIVASLVSLILPSDFGYVEVYGTFVSVVLRLYISIYIYKKCCNASTYFDMVETNKYMVYFIFLAIVCIRIPFMYTEIRDGLMLKIAFISVACCTAIFLIISRIDKHNAEKERAIIEENNKILSTKLHKSQEILPAMVQVLSNVTEKSGTEMEEQEAQKLLEEVSNLYGQQLKENNKEDLQLKNFCSTGLKILDQQLIVYQMEALDKGVNLDIFVQTPINVLLKKENIDQLRLQRAVGDLVRNAFRAMEREDKKCRANGHILLIIGCQCENILEIAVLDNGTAFPLHVIEAFGSRGVTTGGTGNGLADLVEFAADVKASIRLDEFEERTDSFTKKISIIFDKQGMNYFNSPRKEKLENSFWNTCKY